MTCNFTAQPAVARSASSRRASAQASRVPQQLRASKTAFVQKSAQGFNRSSLSVSADIRAQQASIAKGRLQYFDRPIDNSTEYFPQWPNKPFIASVLDKFPEAGIASAEEARVLFSEAGYEFLDVRSEYEVENDGRCPGAVEIEIIQTRRVFNSESTAVDKKDTIQTINREFMDQLKAAFPSKDAKIIVACSDGRNRAIQTLMALDAEGYTNLVGIKGGFNAWFRLFDMKLNRRREDGYQEDYGGMGETACGIHGTGADFTRMDALDKIPLQDQIEWQDWAEEMKKPAY